MRDLSELLLTAFAARKQFFDAKHEAAFRLFNGFIEGCPELAIDLYRKTALIHNYAKPPEAGAELVKLASRLVRQSFAWVEAIIVKERFGDSAETRNGIVTFGTKLTRSIREHGIRYAIDLALNRDASFYLDTRNLRHWLLDNCADKMVLNTFAYTGSLGVAAVAGGASRVVQTDLNKRFLNVAKASHSLNGFPIVKRDFQSGDFWSYINRFKRAGERFDLVIVDPPFFSDTGEGRVDLAQNTIRLINKVRPLVQSSGQIVLINNALFVSGAALTEALQALCVDGWVEIEGASRCFGRFHWLSPHNRFTTNHRSISLQSPNQNYCLADSSSIRKESTDERLYRLRNTQYGLLANCNLIVKLCFANTLYLK